jgi:hypothetical protein
MIDIMENGHYWEIQHMEVHQQIQQEKEEFQSKSHQQ